MYSWYASLDPRQRVLMRCDLEPHAKLLRWPHQCGSCDQINNPSVREDPSPGEAAEGFGSDGGLREGPADGSAELKT